MTDIWTVRSLKAALDTSEPAKTGELSVRIVEGADPILLVTMHEREGVGLAANQVGRLKRVLVAGTEEDEYVLVNPVIEARSEETEVVAEGCLSIPGIQVEVERPDDERQSKAMHGLVRSLVNNMVVGVSEEFSKELEIIGTGYRAALQGSTLDLSLGYSHPVKVDAPEGITFEVPTPTRIVVRGVDKEQVGQVAADIRSLRKPEPYKGKGVRYAGEQVRRKVGKAGK